MTTSKKHIYSMIILNHYFTICSHVLIFVVDDVTFVSSCVFCLFYRGAHIKEIGNKVFDKGKFHFCYLFWKNNSLMIT